MPKTKIPAEYISDNPSLSGTDSVKVPAGTTAQRGTGVAGKFRFNTTLNKFEGYTDSWGEIGGSGGSALETDNFTGDDSTTAFTLSSSVSDEDNLIVFIDGVYQNKADYVASGTTLTLDTAPVAGRKIVVYHVRANVSGSNCILNSFSGNGSTTAFTLTQNPASENNTQVFIDGVYQRKSSYAVSGTTLTFDAAPGNGTAIEVMMFTQTDINTLPASFVSGLTEVTAVGADHMMIFDATDSALKKALVSDVIEGTTGISSSADATAITISSDEDVTLSNRLIFPTSNIGFPDVSDHTTGTRIDYYPSTNATFYATGIAANSLWTMAHKNHFFYIGEGSGTKVARINDEGITVPTATSDGTGTVGTGDQTNCGLEAGQIYFNTTNKVFRGYDGSNWNDLGKGSISQIQGLQLWADVTDGISSTTVADLSGNSRTGTLANTTNKGTLSSNTYVDMVDAQYCQYATGVLPDLPIKNSGACSFFFVCTNRRSNASMGAYIASTSSGVNYQIIRHQSTSDDYSLYLEGASDSVHTSSNTAVPTNSTISEAYIIFFQFQGNSGGIDFEVFKHENGTTSTDSFFLSGVSTGAFAFTDNNQPVRIGNSPWASEELDAGMFAWGFTDTMLTPRERKIIIDYYEAKGLAT